MTSLRGALLGFGQVAQNAHLPAFLARKDLVITAVAEASPARRDEAGRRLPGVRLYESFETLLSSESELDFVVICTPPAFHGKQTLLALDNRLHVLCEKPLTLDKEELEDIERAAAKTSRVAYTCHNWAFSPIWLKAQELLARGAVGAVRHAELHVLRSQPAASAVPGDWRTDPKLAGGGILVDHGWHNLYLLRRLVSGETSQLRCLLHRASSGVDDEATLLLSFPDSTALLHLTWRSALRSNFSVVYGSEGVLELRDDLLLLRSRSAPEQRFKFPEKLSAGSAHPAWNAALLDDFRAEIDGKHRGRNLAEARFVLESVASAYGAGSPAPQGALR